ncbi:ROK family protein [Agrobacterium vitis]|uniref:ROK family protein n=1 Tax=Agrobacterium vitis TaxID=373 RepID=A0ABD6G9X2_AGRVI|nr:ROK family protein [Agrobacterium vitis]MUO78985.1 ROK family protein [Agrobacterium vitis]MUO94548.1 ROK family protein [Agrobacterium vitis]MUP06207.1 ROK family protein [Agrobacterium vitis]MUZ82304.1 ROK family protein [Agrobacterium vitis]MVA11336.1 ROK family protein [Agrobacterium vitis]
MIVCFDIGGTAIKGAIAYSPEDIRPFPRQPTPGQDFNAFVGVIRSIIAEAGETPSCVAISICGIIDVDSRRAVVANIPCLHGRLLQHDLEEALGLPVLIANDADCFAIAEAGLGAGRGHRVVFGVILGTGVGGGLVVDGRLINSDGGFAGEWGHGPIAATEVGEPPVTIPRFQCGCGQKGCIDAICSARGMEKLHTHLSGENRTSEDIVKDWETGEPKASQTIAAFVELLSSPLALVVNTTGASILPVGGGLSNATILVEAIDLAVRARILRRFNYPIVVPAQCRLEPGLIGAALLGLARQN